MKKFFLIFLLLFTSFPCLAMENLFYLLRGSKLAIASLNQHGRVIHILAPQAYRINEKGDFYGEIDPQVLAYVKTHAVKLMPMITNSLFDENKIHQFLTDKQAQTKALQAILDTCQKNKFSGVQFDFESINSKDKDALTAFYQEAFHLLHQHQFLVSFAIVPSPDDTPTSSFEKRKFDHWTGVYNLKALGQFSDFVTIMSYDQHTQGTTPGPTADIRWVNATIKHTLKFIPANKISLGIPLYSGYWFTGKVSANSVGVKVHLEELAYPDVLALIKRNHINVEWDNASQAHYAVYEHHWLNQYLFIEDAKSFAAKVALAKKYHLRGISVFDLGIEDPDIWKNMIFKSN